MIWINIPGFPGYKANFDGQIMSFKDPGGPRILKPRPQKTGYLRVRIQVDGWSKDFNVHTLIARAFHGKRPEGYYICHNDGNKTNNRAGNLRYDTPEANVHDQIKHGTAPWLTMAKRTHCSQNHEFTEDNIYWRTGKNGKLYRKCKKCQIARTIESRRKRKAGLTPTPPKPRVKPLPPEGFVNYEASRTHCDNNHEFTEDNIYWKSSKKNEKAYRRCKICHNAAVARYQARKKAGLI